MTATSRAEAEQESFVPVIDIGGLYSADLAERMRVAEEIGAACDGSGFFYAVNHHVPMEVMEAARTAAARFFALPEEEKLKVESDRNNRGFRKLGDAVHKSGAFFARDSFDFGFPLQPDDPEVRARLPLYAPNKWPDLPGFEKAMSRYYDDCYQVGMKVLGGFALYLGQEENFFSRHFTRPIADMVINHYFTHSDAVRAGGSELANGAHTDHGIVTILWQDASGGLQVLDRNEKWIDVPPIPGSFIINVGELMKRWTNGRFKATIHRVIHTKNVERFSMPLFCNPNFHTEVDPRQLGISDSDAKYPPILSGEFLISRFQATRKLWGADQKAKAGMTAIEMPAD